MPEVAVGELSTGPESVHIGVEAVVFGPRSFQAWWVGRVSAWWNGEVLMRWGSGTVVEEDPEEEPVFTADDDDEDWGCPGCTVVEGEIVEGAVFGRDSGMTTVEYAVGTVVAAAFAAVLYRIVTGDSIVSGLTNLVNSALKTTF